MKWRRPHSATPRRPITAVETVASAPIGRNCSNMLQPEARQWCSLREYKALPMKVLLVAYTDTLLINTATVVTLCLIKLLLLSCLVVTTLMTVSYQSHNVYFN